MVNWKGVLTVAVLMAIAAQIIHTVGAVLTMGYYVDPQYSSVWSKLMMPSAGPPPASFMVLSLIVGFITSLIFAWFYTVVRDSIPGDAPTNKGLNYGLMLYLVAGVPFIATNFLLINLPLGITVSWFFEGLLVYLIGGLLAARLLK